MTKCASCSLCRKSKECKGSSPKVLFCADFEKIQNNFKKITRSTEALAEFITDLANGCGYEMCEKCPIKPYCVSRDVPKEKQLLAWLKQESTE